MYVMATPMPWPLEQSMDDDHPSLELLLPRLRAAAHGYSSPESTTTASTSASSEEETAALLQRISANFENAFKDNAFTVLRDLSEKYISPGFSARFDTAFVGSWNEYANVMSRWVATNPGWKKNVITTSVDIAEDGREATVYILMEVTGWPVELKRLVVSVLKWKKRKRRWMCYENVTMRGIDTFDTAAG